MLPGRLPTNWLRLIRVSPLCWRGSVLSLERQSPTLGSVQSAEGCIVLASLSQKYSLSHSDQRINVGRSQTMADVSALKHNVEKPIFQNSINPDDTILNCNLLDIINVRGELEVILEGNEENSNVINKDTPKININMVSAIDKTAKNDSQIFDSTSNNLSLESHSESHRFDSLLTPYGFDKTSHKSDTLDDSMLAHVVQNPCGRDFNSFVSSSYDMEPTNPPKDSIVVFLMGQVEFLRDEIKIKNNIIERLLTLKSVLHDNQFSSYNSQQIKKINKKFVDKNVDTDDIPEDYQPVTQNNKNMDIIIEELNKSLSGIDESNEQLII